MPLPQNPTAASLSPNGKWSCWDVSLGTNANRPFVLEVPPALDGVRFQVREPVLADSVGVP